MKYIKPTSFNIDHSDIGSDLRYLTLVIRRFWSGSPSGTQRLLDIRNFDSEQFYQTSHFDPDKIISRNQIKEFLEMIRSLQLLIRKTVFRMTEVGRTKRRQFLGRFATEKQGELFDRRRLVPFHIWITNFLGDTWKSDSLSFHDLNWLTWVEILHQILYLSRMYQN